MKPVACRGDIFFLDEEIHQSYEPCVQMMSFAEKLSHF